eukprot:scaffold216235_cov18-Tisochrysis_lutea.AAC.4
MARELLANTQSQTEASQCSSVSLLAIIWPMTKPWPFPDSGPSHRKPGSFAAAMCFSCSWARGAAGARGRSGGVWLGQRIPLGSAMGFP